MKTVWAGIIRHYADRLSVPADAQVITLGEGGTALLPARQLSEHLASEVYMKVEGMNPTGSFKDRGMTVAMTLAAHRGAHTVLCASTGNTSASAAAYAAAAGLRCVVLVPEGKIAMGKLSQALAHGAQLLHVQGNFDQCLVAARQVAQEHPVELVNSVNPDRIEGQKTAAFEVVDALGQAPDIHALPVGNAGNISAYWRGYCEYSTAWGGHAPLTSRCPRMWGFQAAGAAPLVSGQPVSEPETIATAIRIGHPASWQGAVAARDESGGVIEAVTDEEILSAHRWLSEREGVFVEPASAAGVAGVLKKHRAGQLRAGQRIVITVTGHGLKDPQWALHGAETSEAPATVGADVDSIASALGLRSAAV